MRNRAMGRSPGGIVQTDHSIFFENSASMDSVAPESVHLVVTSPPYPMIEMWDGLFCALDPRIGPLLSQGHGTDAFERMHRQLDPVWAEMYRVLVPGGIACINIGDATRTLGGDFRLYPNHSRILQKLLDLGFSVLPSILWRKPTNAPTKFMGSGMLPAGAYVTLEHEWIVIVRKGPRRRFVSNAERENRRRSAIFWEERNAWFSDVWFDLRGTAQTSLPEAHRQRSGAFPFELAYRLIQMFSVKGDRILDPFLGTGTTLAAAMASARNSMGFEMDESFKGSICEAVEEIVERANEVNASRLQRHVDFVLARIRSGGRCKFINKPYGFPVVSGQETDLILNDLIRKECMGESSYRIFYRADPQGRFQQDWNTLWPYA